MLKKRDLLQLNSFKNLVKHHYRLIHLERGKMYENNNNKKEFQEKKKWPY